MEYTQPCLNCQKPTSIMNKDGCCSRICANAYAKKRLDTRTEEMPDLPTFEDLKSHPLNMFRRPMSRQELATEKVQKAKEHLRMLGFNPDTMPEFAGK